jgi:hypothetical protein
VDPADFDHNGPIQNNAGQAGGRDVHARGAGNKEQREKEDKRGMAEEVIQGNGLGDKNGRWNDESTTGRDNESTTGRDNESTAPFTVHPSLFTLYSSLFTVHCYFTNTTFLVAM